MSPVSFWAGQLGDGPRRAPLGGPRRVDVCVVGGGFTGLWTAYELRRAAPELEVLLLEAEHVGFGASGRNGGWVQGMLAGSREGWARRGGRDGAVAQERAIRATVAEVGAVVAREEIDCGWKQGGTLHLARSAVELARLRAEQAEHRAWGNEDSELLGASELRTRLCVDGGLGAVYSPHCARVDPARLVRGLAAAAERAGAELCEDTRVSAIEPHLVRTPHGDVEAGVVVRATEGYTAGLHGERRTLLPLGSSMIVTEVLPEETWAELGWANAETVLDGQRLYAYLQRTPDGRIAIGGRGAPYRWGSATEREGPVPARTVRELTERLELLFPPLRGLEPAGAWHGILGVPRDWQPAVGLDRDRGLAWAGGYVGEGVAAANLAGRTLRDLILGRETHLTELPWVGPFGRAWEPEPLRWTGVRLVHGLMQGADRREARTGRSSRLASVAGTISGRS